MNFLQMALEQAFRSVGISRPNPAVGAVVVKDGIVVGRGATQSPGNAHAEVMALRDAGELARGAAIYVTLEPCCHYGRTPPCTKAIIEAGIKEVYFAHADPNPAVRGKSRGILEAAGIKVYEGKDACVRAEFEEWDTVCSRDGCMNLAAPWNHREGDTFADIERFYEAYDYFVCNKGTFVEVKSAVTENGFMGLRLGDGKNAPLKITGDGANCWNHELRAMSDAVLVGSGTLLADNPSLDVRYVRGNSPVKIIWAPTHVFSAEEVARLKAFDVASKGKCLVYSGEEQPALSVEVCPLNPSGSFEENWAAMLEDLYSRGMHRLMVEPGAGLAAKLLGLESGKTARRPLWNRLDLWKSMDVSAESALGELGEGLEFPGVPAGAIARESAMIGPDVLTIYGPASL